MKHIIIGLGAILVLIGGFFALTTYVYNEKQADPVLREEHDTTQDIEGREGGSVSPNTPAQEPALTGKTWVWAETQYEDGRVITPRVKGKFTLEFRTDGSFGAGTDCNGVGGNYSINNSSITLGQMISTLMYCEGSQENEFRTMLEHSTGYSFGPDGSLILHLKFDSGSVVFW